MFLINQTKGKKKYRLANLHAKTINAREKKLPMKLSEIGAACVAVGVAIERVIASYGMPIGAAIVSFLVCSIIFQILIRLIFLIISAVSRPAFNKNTGLYVDVTPKRISFSFDDKYADYEKEMKREKREEFWEFWEEQEKEREREEEIFRRHLYEDSDKFYEDHKYY